MLRSLANDLHTRERRSGLPPTAAIEGFAPQSVQAVSCILRVTKSLHGHTFISNVSHRAGRQ